MKTRGLDFKVKEDIDKIRNEHKSGSFGPALIRDALLDLHYTEDQLPHINLVQNYVSYKKKLHSGNHDIQSFNHQLQQLTQQDATHTYDAFVYGTCIAEDGTVKVGSGHENDHFHASFTSNRLLANIRGAQEHNDIGEWPMTFCIDFTFKTNLLGFFFGVMGVVDACRHFFLGAITLLSHKTTADYETSIADFKRICLGAGKFVLNPTYCMLDGESAIQNALENIFGEMVAILMCFFHVMKNCKEHLKGVPRDLKEKVLKKIRSLHMSKNAMEFHLRLEEFCSFLSSADLLTFMHYFLETWVNGTHKHWRIFDCRAGVGNTNNAVESFNSHFKEEFLNNKKYSLDQLVLLIVRMIRYFSCKDQVFKLSFTPEAKHRSAAQSMLTTNTIIGNTFFPTPYRATANADGTYTWCKGFPLPERLHRTYTVQISKEQDDFCKCPVFLKLSYCKHVLATVNKFGLTSKRLGQGKFANQTENGGAAKETHWRCVLTPLVKNLFLF